MLKNHLRLLYTFSSLLLTVLLSSCASQPKQDLSTLYTRNEQAKMSYCMGTAGTVRSVSQRKLMGFSKSKQLERFKDAEFSDIKLKLVEMVYAADVKNSWDYTISFFKQCSARVANIPNSRIRMASFCNLNSLIADVAYSFKVRNDDREKVYMFFKGMNQGSIKKVVNKVYDENKSAGEARLEAWNSCMANFSGKKE